jgi:hypothetical protein
MITPTFAAIERIAPSMAKVMCTWSGSLPKRAKNYNIGRYQDSNPEDGQHG